MSKRVVIYGAGGHGKVVFDVLIAAGMQVMGFVDDRPGRHDVLGKPVLGSLWSFGPVDGVIVAIGENRTRAEKYRELRSAGVELVNAIHPNAVVSPYARLGNGILVAPGVVVNVDAVIGDNTILNTGASVDHDCVIGDHVHIAPASTLGGTVLVDDGAFLGIGTRVVPGMRIGSWSTTGAGSVVIRHVEPGSTVIGVPARPLIDCGEHQGLR